jgi:hypothetical protein
MVTVAVRVVRPGSPRALPRLCAVSVTEPPVAPAGAVITKNPCRQGYTKFT